MLSFILYHDTKEIFRRTYMKSEEFFLIFDYAPADQNPKLNQ